MSATRSGTALTALGRLFRRGTLPSGDGALLECFRSEGDESAFEAIVARHGSMVLGVCRRMLADPHDADDAFQATFLVLVKKASRLRDGDRLGPWLYGVATRVATKARAKDAKRRALTSAVPDDLPCPGNAGSDWHDVRPILDAELLRLSPKLRDILVLCLLEGLTAEEAARQLACPLGTVKSRLARGREALRGRLATRGLAPAVALAVAAGTSKSALASPVSEALGAMTVRLAGLAVEQVPSAVAALTRGVALNMLPKSSVLTAAVCGGIVLAGVGVGATAWQNPPMPGAPPAGLQAGAGDAAKRAKAQSMNHFKETLLAFANCQVVHQSLPPKAIFGSDGKPKLSWRVALLPFLNQQALYEEFHLDEPWDSPHNKPLVAKMPETFTTPDSPTARGWTRIRVFEGPGTLFNGDKGFDNLRVTDGCSNTVTIVSAADAVPWTKPGDLTLIEAKPLPALDAPDNRGVLVGMADGSVRHVPSDDQTLWKALISPTGGEVFQLPSDWQAGPPQAMTNAEVVPLPGGKIAVKALKGARIMPPITEQRLQLLETKLDEILRRLDALEKAARDK
jgi:RNA polymerase sigma factor (sigma-70 family)